MPDAPTPRFDSTGSLLAGWHITLRYDPDLDHLEVYWAQEAGGYTKATRETTRFRPVDIEDALAAVQRRTRILGARRLF